MNYQKHVISEIRSPSDRPAGQHPAAVKKAAAVVDLVESENEIESARERDAGDARKIVTYLPTGQDDG